MRSIITISREFGSGGREIGKILSEQLGIPFYDKELLEIASKESGICKELFVTHDENYTNSFLYSLVMLTEESIRRCRLITEFFLLSLIQ